MQWREATHTSFLLRKVVTEQTAHWHVTPKNSRLFLGPCSLSSLYLNRRSEQIHIWKRVSLSLSHAQNLCVLATWIAFWRATRTTIDDLQTGSRLIHQYTLASRTQRLQTSLRCACACVCARAGANAFKLWTMETKCPTESRSRPTESKSRWGGNISLSQAERWSDTVTRLNTR